MSPTPLQPSKGDFVLLAAGVPPFHYHNHPQRVTSQERALAVYLDVSGNINQHIAHRCHRCPRFSACCEA